MTSTQTAALMAGGAVGLAGFLLGVGLGWAVLLGAVGAVATGAAINNASA